MSPLILSLVLVAGGFVVAAVVVAAVAWKVPGADEALVVTGWRPRVVRSRGTFVWPLGERAARVDLSLHDLTIDVDLASAEGIALRLFLDGSWQVRGEDRSIGEAARHFVRRPDLAARQVGGSVASGVRAAVGALPAAALLDGGVAAGLAELLAVAVAADLDPLGLTMISLDVTGIDDTAGYLGDLARPQLARAASAARIAAAQADAGAVEAEQRARAVRDRAGVVNAPGIARSVS
ncbi:MAG: SPFH domain-containing protein [Actinomycetota bacterium]|nr:SPFH domain-containing protein [Actinomycetota bacterium]